MCAPVSDLRNDEAPARVLVADWGVGRGTKTKEIGFDTVRSAHAQVTAGIAADGVEAIELVDDQGKHRVPTQSNAFIYVAEAPEVGDESLTVRRQPRQIQPAGTQRRLRGDADEAEDRR